MQARPYSVQGIIAFSSYKQVPTWKGLHRESGSKLVAKSDDVIRLLMWSTLIIWKYHDAIVLLLQSDWSSPDSPDHITSCTEKGLACKTNCIEYVAMQEKLEHGVVQGLK